jgi:putative ABC transport system substrate-binding protein
MRRREFVALIGGVAASRPLGSHAQQAERMRRVGVLLPATADDREFQARILAFRQEIEKLGWTEGRNIRIDYHWAAAGADRLRAAASMVASAPDAILADSTVILAALKSVTQTVPIVFVQVPDPVQGGFVASLARPGGNITGFTNFEYTLGEKWLELLKEVVPGVARAGVLQNPADRASTEYTRAIAAVAPSTEVQVTAASPKNAIEIEPAIAPFARESNAGLIVLPGVFTFINHKAIVTLAAQLRLPAVYPYRYFVTAGGLISYGVETVDLYRRAASYVDRILKAEKPANLPVQAPNRFELVVNVKTAKTLGLALPPMLMARADDVIE